MSVETLRRLEVAAWTLALAAGVFYALVLACVVDSPGTPDRCHAVTCSKG